MCLQMATEIIVNVESVFFLFQTFSYIQKGIHLIPNSLLPLQLHWQKLLFMTWSSSQVPLIDVSCYKVNVVFVKDDGELAVDGSEDRKRNR